MPDVLWATVKVPGGMPPFGITTERKLNMRGMLSKLMLSFALMIGLVAPAGIAGSTTDSADAATSKCGYSLWWSTTNTAKLKLHDARNSRAYCNDGKSHTIQVQIKKKGAFNRYWNHSWGKKVTVPKRASRTATANACGTFVRAAFIGRAFVDGNYKAYIWTGTPKSGFC